MRVDRSVASTQVCPTGFPTLRSPAVGTVGYNETSRKNDPGIYWQVVRVHKVQNEAKERRRLQGEPERMLLRQLPEGAVGYRF